MKKIKILHIVVLLCALVLIHNQNNKVRAADCSSYSSNFDICRDREGLCSEFVQTDYFWMGDGTKTLQNQAFYCCDQIYFQWAPVEDFPCNQDGGPCKNEGEHCDNDYECCAGLGGTCINNQCSY